MVEAERGVDVALRSDDLLGQLQSAIVASHRYPSQALELVSRPDLRARADDLRARVMAALRDRAHALPEPAARARVVFGLIGELSSRAAYEEDAEAMKQLLALARGHLE